MSDLEKIKSKVSKLFELSKNNPSPEEAGLAAQKAYELLRKYSLEKSDIEQVSKSEVEILFSDYVIGGKSKKTRIPDWEVFILHAIAQSWNCETVKYHGIGVVIVGEKQDFDAIKYLFKCVISDVKQTAKIVGNGKGRKWNHDFKYGCSVAICRRLEESKKEIESKLDSRYLVLFDKKQDKIELKFKEHGIIMGKTKSRRVGDGYKAGLEHGNKINLSENNVRIRADSKKYLKA